MIKLNHEPYPHSEGMTIRSLLLEKNFTLGNIVVRINGEVVDKGKWDIMPINDGDDVEMFHIFGGG